MRIGAIYRGETGACVACARALAQGKEYHAGIGRWDARVIASLHEAMFVDVTRSRTTTVFVYDAVRDELDRKLVFELPGCADCTRRDAGMRGSSAQPNDVIVLPGTTPQLSIVPSLHAVTAWSMPPSVPTSDACAEPSLDTAWRYDAVVRYRRPAIEARPLDEALRRRRSAMTFKASVSIDDLLTALTRALRVTRFASDGKKSRTWRTYPSAGALYPVDAYVVARGTPGLVEAVWYWNALEETLERVCDADGDAVYGSVFGLGTGRDPGAIIVLVASYERSAWKYGARAYRFALTEAGCIAQNLQLVCADQALASVMIGAFDDRGLADELSLANNELPLLVVAVG